MWCCAHVASAQTSRSSRAPAASTPAPSASTPPAPSAVGTPAAASAAEAELHQTKLALERAHFDDAAQLAKQLLASPELPASLRNQALELLAIAQVAARKEREARDTLRNLYRRDPAYPRQVTDPGPAVDAAFARVRLEGVAPLRVTMRHVVEQDLAKRLRVSVDLTAERDAVESVHVFVEERSGVRLAHLVGEVQEPRPLSFVLPQAAPGADNLGLVIEARAPSGAVLGRLGEVGEPLQVAVPRAPPPPACPPAAKPLRREWWLWTTVGLVVSAFVVASAVAVN
jgi:hypothetical protein